MKSDLVCVLMWLGLTVLTGILVGCLGGGEWGLSGGLLVGGSSS